jgi:hypothetical protein
MKKLAIGLITLAFVATAALAYQAEEHKKPGMGGMMQGMMGDQKSSDGSSMQDMMSMMMKMMEQCSQMMGTKSELKKEEPSK